MLFFYETEIDNIFDSNTLTEKYVLTADQLAADNWRDQMILEGRSTTQNFAQQLVDEGYTGLLVRSYALGTTDRDQNLVLWYWVQELSAMLTLIDDENRLTY